jgi:hypothetical protein
MNYNFLVLYHVNSFLQLSFNSTNICGFKVFNTKKNHDDKCGVRCDGFKVCNAKKLGWRVAFIVLDL